MTWSDKVKEFGGCDVAFLTEDGEVITIVICGDPELFKGKYKGQETKRVAFPVATVDGVTILVVGMRTARRLAKHEKHHHDMAFEIIRHGTQGDQDATYDVAPVADEQLTRELFAIKQREFKPKDLPEMFANVEDMIKG